MKRYAFVFLLVSLLAGLTGGIGVGIAGANTGHVFTIEDVAATEGSGNGTGSVSVSVKLSPAPEAGEFVQVDFGTSAQASQGATAKTTAPADATPDFPEDFAQTDGTVTFLATETAKSVSIPVLADNADEPNEMFFVQLFNARGGCLIPETCSTGASIDDGRATVTINDDDAEPSFSINDVEHNEGNSGTTTYDFSVKKIGGSGVPITVDVATADASATQPGDYAARSETLTFAPSSPSEPETKTVDVKVTGDTAFEPSETFTVNLSGATHSTIADGEGVGTITNDDAPPPPSMSANDASGGEGDAMNFIVTLSAPPGPGQTATVDWALEGTTGEGNATEGVDYAAASGSVLFTAGESEQTVSVPTIEDAVDEAAEDFSLRLSKPAAAGTGGYAYNIARDLSVGTIEDDDAAPTLSIESASVDPEGASGVTTATFMVFKTGLTDRGVSVDVATSDVTATAGADYQASAVELTFAPNETAMEFTVEVLGDELDEIDEIFDVALTEAVNATIDGGQAEGVIVDDDVATTSFSIDNIYVTEGNSGTAAATFTVTKTGDTGRSTAVSFITSDNSALEGVDYNETSGDVSFAADETSKPVSVEIRGDKLDEVSESFFVDLASPENANVTDGHGWAVIKDDDAAPAMAISNGSVKEYSNNSCNLTVKLNAPSGREIRVHYATATGSAGSSDFLAKSGDLRFAPGQVATVIKVYARSDSHKEKTETFSVKLSGVNPAGTATFADSTGTCSILDND